MASASAFFASVQIPKKDLNNFEKYIIVLYLLFQGDSNAFKKDLFKR